MQYKNLKYAPLFAILLLITASCQKVINLKLGSAASQLVIEGNITGQASGPTVKISRSVPVGNTNTYPAVSGAAVNIADNKGNTYKLTEGTTAGTYTISKFSGRTGYTYTLSVLTGGVTYTGSSTMPALVNFDQLTYRDDSFNNKNTKLLTVHFHDMAGVANQYLFVMYVNSVQVKTIFVTDDSFTDGGFVDLDLYQGDITIKTGDNVIVDMQCIDRNIYTYWYSLSQQVNNSPGGGTTPSNPPSNLNNNALGYFSAHTIQRQTLIIQ